MPFKPVELPKCPVCNKSVYAAEEKLGKRDFKGLEWIMMDWNGFSRGSEVARGLLQVQHVQQDAGQHQQQRQGQQAILQGSSISSVNDKWVPYFFGS